MDSTPLDMIATLVAIEANFSNSNRNLATRDQDPCFACELQATSGSKPSTAPPPPAAPSPPRAEPRPGGDSDHHQSEELASQEADESQPANAAEVDQPSDEADGESESDRAGEIIVALIQPESVPRAADGAAHPDSSGLPVELVPSEHPGTVPTEAIDSERLPTTEPAELTAPAELDAVALPEVSTKAPVTTAPATPRADEIVEQPTSGRARTATEADVQTVEVTSGGEPIRPPKEPRDEPQPERDRTQNEPLDRTIGPGPVVESRDTVAPADAAPVEIAIADAAPVPPATPDERLPVAGSESSQLDATNSRLAQHLVSGSRERNTAQPAISDADQVRMIQRVARAVHSAQERGGPLRIRLSPPELGSLTLELRVASGMISARIETETALSRTLLLDNLPMLRERLAEQGVRVERFDVDIFQQPRGGTGDNPGDPRSDTPRPNPQTLRRDDPAESPTAAETSSGHVPAETQGLNVVV